MLYLASFTRCRIPLIQSRNTSGWHSYCFSCLRNTRAKSCVHILPSTISCSVFHAYEYICTHARTRVYMYVRERTFEEALSKPYRHYLGPQLRYRFLMFATLDQTTKRSALHKFRESNGFSRAIFFTG